MASHKAQTVNGQGGIKLSSGFLLLPGILSLLCLLLAVFAEPLREVAMYHRELLAGGQWWRILTAHLVHLGWSHVLLNLAGLWLVWLLLGPVYSVFQWCMILLLSALSVSAGLWFFSPHILWYVGFSGVLHGLMAAGVLSVIRGFRIELAALGVLLVVKLLYEQLLGPLPGSESGSGGAVVVDAHLWGAMGGLFAALLLWRRAHR